PSAYLTLVSVPPSQYHQPVSKRVTLPSVTCVPPSETHPPDRCTAASIARAVSGVARPIAIAIALTKTAIMPLPLPCWSSDGGARKRIPGYPAGTACPHIC